MTRVNGDITIRPKDIFKFGHKKKTGNSLLTQIVQSLGCPRLGRLTVLDMKLPGPQDVWPPRTHLLHCPFTLAPEIRARRCSLNKRISGPQGPLTCVLFACSNPHAFVAPSFTSGGPPLHLPSPPRTPIALRSSHFASSVLCTLLSLTCRFPCSMNSRS